MGAKWDDLCNHTSEGMRKGDAARITNVKAVGGFQDGAGGNPFSRSRVRYGANLDRKLNSMQEWHRAWLVECYRVLVPGGVIKAFSATRTFHRMAAAMQEAGFTDIRLEAWSYGSGFPKSLNIGKSIEGGLRGRGARYSAKDPSLVTTSGQSTPGHLWDSAARRTMKEQGDAWSGASVQVTMDEAKVWDGWGTALKPSWEPVLVGTKPA